MIPTRDRMLIHPVCDFKGICILPCIIPCIIIPYYYSLLFLVLYYYTLYYSLTWIAVADVPDYLWCGNSDKQCYLQQIFALSFHPLSVNQSVLTCCWRAVRSMASISSQRRESAPAGSWGGPLRPAGSWGGLLRPASSWGVPLRSASSWGGPLRPAGSWGGPLRPAPPTASSSSAISDLLRPQPEQQSGRTIRSVQRRTYPPL